MLVIYPHYTYSISFVNFTEYCSFSLCSLRTEYIFFCYSSNSIWMLFFSFLSAQINFSGNEKLLFFSGKMRQQQKHIGEFVWANVVSAQAQISKIETVNKKDKQIKAKLCGINGCCNVLFFFHFFTQMCVHWRSYNYKLIRMNWVKEQHEAKEKKTSSSLSENRNKRFRNVCMFSKYILLQLVNDSQCSAVLPHHFFHVFLCTHLSNAIVFGWILLPQMWTTSWNCVNCKKFLNLMQKMNANNLLILANRRPTLMLHTTKHISTYDHVSNIIIFNNGSLKKTRFWPLQRGACSRMPEWVMHHLYVDFQIFISVTISKGFITSPLLTAVWKSHLIHLIILNAIQQVRSKPVSADCDWPRFSHQHIAISWVENALILVEHV